MSVQHVASDLTPIGGLPQAAGEPADTDDEGMDYFSSLFFGCHQPHRHLLLLTF